MGNVVELKSRVPAMTDDAIFKVRQLETCIRTLPQENIATQHVLHGGQYTRTIMIPADVVLTGVLIKIPTTLIVSGDCTVFFGDESVRVRGYNVFAASAHRKQAFVAHSDVFVTMSFSTKANTIEAAELEFTDEAHLLFSRNNDAENHFLITGE